MSILTTRARNILEPSAAQYSLNGSETRALSTIGAFRVVPERDLRDRDAALDDRGDLRHLEKQGLIERLPLDGRDRASPTEAAAYLKEAECLRNEDARIVRVQLDRELKRDYQRFLQERNQGDRESDGRPNRSREEVEDWARDHDLPYYDDQVHFPDARIEYEDLDGDVRHLDIEVTTEHYRGGHASSANRSGFAIHRSGGGGSGSAPFDPGVAEDFL